ncbi:MAG: hypothetical protein F6K47_33640 [Symploca sp. SIO2E6]|nr:hypothetical protein [Symploca sp. SIO2E6]
MNSEDHGLKLDSDLNETLNLEVSLIVNSNGQGEFISATPESHSKLAGEIIQKLQFEPTYSDCKPVAHFYNLTITIVYSNNE